MTDESDTLNLALIRHQMLAVESNLHQLQLRHDQLEHQSVKLASNIAVKRVKHAPFRDLIPELCHIIFSYCPPLLLTHVCSRWRDMAIRDPSLWTDIHVRPKLSDQFRIKTWLARSGDMPLDVAFSSADFRDRVWDTRLVGKPFLIQLLIPHVHRIRSFKTYLGQEILPALFTTPPLHMPLLRELDIIVDHTAYNGFTVAPLHAPNLRSLRVRDVTPFLDILDNTFPHLQSLTILESKSWRYPHSFTKVLENCSHLRQCSVSFPRNLSFQDADPFVLPRVKSLDFSWSFFFDPIPIFNAIRAPALESLTLSHTTSSIILPPNILASLHPLLRSTHFLTSLTIAGCNVLALDEAAGLLSEARNLTTLELLNCQRVDRFVIPLTSRPSSWICPHLATLRITSLQDSDASAILDFAKSRTAASGEEEQCLQELFLDSRLHNLSRQARFLMLCGLADLRHSLNITGSFGELVAFVN